ncbi:MAG TPA: phosphoheptose isomerase, partial [Acidimicrobiia bacterium]
MRVTSEELADRLQAKDPNLWGAPDTPELANRLGWVDLPQTMAPLVADWKAVASAALADQTDDVVLLGMGGSSLAPRVFASVLGIARGHPRLSVLDSTHPDELRALAAAIDPGRTIFLVSSKSGGTIETLSGFRYFWRATGGDGQRFIAITDEGSSLHHLAGERGFRAAVLAPSDVG